jgi:uncharacterized protein (TIGR03437 family)
MLPEGVQMTRQRSKQLFARMERLCRVARLTLLLSSLVCGTGAINSQAQTEPQQSRQTQTWETLHKRNSITPGYKIIEGDIQVPLTSAPGATLERNLWPDGIVYYAFDDNVIPENRVVARAAMRVWERVASVTFREIKITVSGPGILIKDADFNNSAVGWKIFPQVINFTSWNTPYRLVHELGHALGLVHEQSRADREVYVQINPDNIEDGHAGDFERRDNSVRYGPYDFDSVMQYDQCAFAKNCDCDKNLVCKNPSITVLAPFTKQWQTAIGQRDHLSYFDGLTMSFLYPRGDFRFVDAASSVQSGSFLDPYQSLSIGISATPTGGALWIQPGSYTDVTLLSKPMTLRAPLGNVTIRHIERAAGPPPVAAVSAASYNGELSAESIVAAFGENLASSTLTATSVPLPTTLGGVTVKITDSAGVERKAPLFFVSPTQINYQVPPGASIGISQIGVYNGDQVVAGGTVPIVPASPGLFSANSNGQGVPAASVLRVRGDGQFYEPVARYDAQLQQFVPEPIDLGPEGDQVFLILFGTGIRAAGAAGVRVMIGDEEAELLYAGVAPGFVGLDQVNLRLPRSLIGKGAVTIQLTADNRSANPVLVSIR